MYVSARRNVDLSNFLLLTKPHNEKYFRSDSFKSLLKYKVSKLKMKSANTYHYYNYVVCSSTSVGSCNSIVICELLLNLDIYYKPFGKVYGFSLDIGCQGK
jgi:hypothetical protein